VQSGLQCVADIQAVLGEGPVWVEREEALYWVDIKGCQIFRLDSGGDVRSWPTPFRIGSIAPREGGGFIAGTENGIGMIDLGANAFDLVDDPEADLPDNRFNDGKVDRSGRFWAGTMDDTERSARGTLYRIDPDLGWTPVDRDYRVTNGPAFSPAGEVMYHNDSARQVTYAFDLDRGGHASNRREFARYGEGEGYPDGMAVDSEGCLWIAFWDGWCVRRYSPAGECLETIATPVSRPTSCAFGGINLDLLYITSARIGLDGLQLSKEAQAGGLFVVSPGVKGIAEQPFSG
jgi:xylono-1,5-lactonase